MEEPVGAHKVRRGADEIWDLKQERLGSGQSHSYDTSQEFLMMSWIK